MPATAIALRLAQPDDSPAIAMMSRDFIERGLEWRYRPAHVARLIADRDTSTLVACDQGRRVGFAMMEFGEDIAHLILLAVQPAHRRQGVGRRMVEWLLQSAHVAGIGTIHLELRANNEGARAFYRSLGFHDGVLMERYYDHRETALRMTRVLRDPA